MGLNKFALFKKRYEVPNILAASFMQETTSHRATKSTEFYFENPQVILSGSTRELYQAINQLVV
ncbi:MAG: hypothetical protein DWQ05_13770 [Calditrichaeota bacterium]|nr:MAG: hypothetical protein DWQ05_13770 [Calditrichota bacterium]